MREVLTVNTIMTVFFTISIIGCKNISYKKTILTVGKIDMISYAGKNGATGYSYFINGKRYLGIDRFDIREFSHGDMVLLYIDKADPTKTHMPFPKVKILPIASGYDSICTASLGINLEDFRLISAYSYPEPQLKLQP
jgi:hypothetical protein